MSRDTPARRLIGAGVVAVAGVICIVLPTVIAGTTLIQAPLFPILRTAMERFAWPMVLLLACLGVAAGLATNLRPIVIALSAVAVLPLVMIAEMVRDPTSHNLFPFEVLMHAVLAATVLIGVFAARALMPRKAV